MADIRDFCRNWQFCENFQIEWTQSPITGQAVTLPHTAVELPIDYFDENSYQRLFTYQKRIQWDDAFEGKEVLLVFDAAMANAHVYIDGALTGKHADGYTPFEIRLTDHLTKEGILLTVCIDGSENPDIPPFGGQIDYLTYAGIYREVWLKIADPVYISNVKIETPDALAAEKSIKIDCYLSNPQDLAVSGMLSASLFNGEGDQIAILEADVDSAQTQISFEGLTNITLWSLKEPALYQLRLTLKVRDSVDQIEKSFGFRDVNFAADGFRLNGKKIKLMGLNRHQSFPYSGYAQGRASQERDAEILKNELSCNIVRTSHYPQSTWFLDHCDRIGLLVLEEIPGWQHIGGDVWKDEAVENVRRMIERDWNHPSIILWGVRINESSDDDAFYARTNALARELDATRQTGGIRKDTESNLLEDVYTFNEFILGDFEQSFSNRPRTAARDQQEVTGLQTKVPYLITEYNGHMYPTKVFDQEQRQMEHVTRHLDMLNAVYGDDSISGCIGWCMFDYNTHKDFGSGDRVCHHGVLSQYREPKFAAYAYASQGDPQDNLVLEPVNFWSRGERNIGGTLPLMVLTNCEFVRLKFASGVVKDIYPDETTYPHLPHPPAFLRHEDVEDDDVGTWGMQWIDVEMIGMLNGEAVMSRKFVADPLATRLEVVADGEVMDANFDEMRVMIRALDQVGNKLPFIDAPIKIKVSGPATLIGPDDPVLKGGATGFWVRSNGRQGDIKITVESHRFETARTTISSKPRQ